MCIFKEGDVVRLSSLGTLSGSKIAYEEAEKIADKKRFGRIGKVVSHKLIRGSRDRLLIKFDKHSFRFHNGGTHGKRHGGKDGYFFWVDNEDIVKVHGNKLEW